MVWRGQDGTSKGFETRINAMHRSEHYSYLDMHL